MSVEIPPLWSGWARSESWIWRWAQIDWGSLTSSCKCSPFFGNLVSRCTDAMGNFVTYFSPLFWSEMNVRLLENWLDTHARRLRVELANIFSISIIVCGNLRRVWIRLGFTLPWQVFSANYASLCTFCRHRTSYLYERHVLGNTHNARIRLSHWDGINEMKSKPDVFAVSTSRCMYAGISRVVRML